MSIGSTVKRQVKEKYTEILQQKLKRYRIHFTADQRHIFYSVVSLGTLGAVFLLACLTDPVRKIAISHLSCQSAECMYLFTVAKPLKKHIYMYSIVNGAAQTHMKYNTPTVEAIDMITQSIFPTETADSTAIPNISECTPYVANGQWVYPCGVSMSTFPQDKYRIFSLQDRKEVSIEIDTLKEQIGSWTNPSTFSAGRHKIGEISELKTGEYILLVQKQLSHPLPDREVVIMGNIGKLGTAFYNTGAYIVAAAASLAIINSLAYMVRA